MFFGVGVEHHVRQCCCDSHQRHHTHTLSLSLSHSLTHTHTHTHSHTHSHSHTLTLTHTHTMRWNTRCLTHLPTPPTWTCRYEHTALGALAVFNSDGSRTAVLSPAAHFPTTVALHELGQTLSFGVHGPVSSAPAGFAASSVVAVRAHVALAPLFEFFCGHLSLSLSLSALLILLSCLFCCAF